MAGALRPAHPTPATTGAGVLVGLGAVGVSVVCVLPVFLTAGLAVQIGADLGFSAGALGLAPAAFFGAMALTSPFTGRVVGRWGVAPTIRVAVLATAVLLAAVAVAAGRYGVLIGLLALAGCANALAQPATNQLVALAVPPARRGLAYGAKYSAIPVAAMLSGLAVPTLGLTVGWRWAFAAVAGLAAGAALLPLGRVRTTATELAPGAGGADSLGRPLLLLLATGAGLAAAAGSAMTIFMVAGAVEAGWGEGSAGLISATASAMGTLARLAAGVRADRRNRNHLGSLVLMLTVGALPVLGLASGVPLLFAAVAPLAFAAGWGWPGLFVLAVVSLNRLAPAAATGLTQTGTSLGCVVGPAGFGLLAEQVSWAIAWSAVAVVMLLAAAVVQLGRRRIRRHVPAVGGSVYGPPPRRPAEPRHRHRHEHRHEESA